MSNPKPWKVLAVAVGLGFIYATAVMLLLWWIG